MRSLFIDRRFWLLLLLSVVVVLVGRVLVSADYAMWLVKVSGYWVTFALTAAAVWAVVRLGARWRMAEWRPWLDWRCWGLILLTTLIWRGHEPHGFRILADEGVLLGTAQHLHLERAAGYGVRATDVRGPFEIIEVYMDKRPLMFPFLVSVVHDLSGYRLTNPFWVNSALGVGFLALAIGLGRKITGSMSGGLVSALWWAGVPLLAQQTGGGGFDLLNLCLLTAWLWLAMIYAERPDKKTQDVFVLTAVALGSTRYESLIYLVPTAGLLLVMWARAGRALFTPLTWVAPLFLLPVFWLNLAFKANEDFWEMKSRGADAPFGLQYLPDNLGHALAHFFSLDGLQPNSVGFGLVGLLALPLLGLWFFRRLQAIRDLSGADLGLFCGIVGLAGGSGVMLVYFWGQFDHPVIHRLSLPTQLLMMVALLVTAARMFPVGPRTWRWLGGAAAVTLLVWSLPTMARQAYRQTYAPGLAYEWRQRVIDGLSSRNVLVIDRDSFFWVANEFSATPNKQAQIRKEGIAFHFRHRSFDEILVVQNVEIDPASAEARVVPDDELGAGYELETITEHRIAMFKLIRLSRVTAINEEPAPSDSGGSARGDNTGAINVLDRAAFERAWIRNLP